MTLSMPEPLGVDTDLESDETGGLGVGVDQLDAPEFTLNMPSQEDFNDIINGSGSAFRPNGFSTTIKGGDATGTRAQVVDYAKKFLGMQYRWGGSNPNTSFDCSGFTQYVLGKFGVHLPRISYQQANYGKHVSLGSLEAGDLVAWDNSSRNNGADHVALYIGNGRIMEFYRTGKPSRIRKLGQNEGAIGVHINYSK